MAQEARLGRDKFVKRHMPINVVEAAKIRLRRLMVDFSTIVVSYSGGKDSLVVLRLMEEIWKEKGYRTKIKVAFYDEEFLPMDVINYVDSFWKSGKYDFKWLAIRVLAERVSMGKTINYRRWEPGREWVRPIPEGAITSDDLGFEIGTQHEMTKVIAHVYGTQDVCVLLGLRAQESLSRLKGVAGNSGRCDMYMQPVPGVARAAIGRPIYDWTEFDVFKYLSEHDGYCPVYDKQMYCDVDYRVATCLHGDAIAKLDSLQAMDPWLFDRCCAIFPDVATQARYGKSIDKHVDTGVIAKYAPTFDGIREYIRDTFADWPERCDEVVQMIDKVEARRSDILRRSDTDPLGGYPILYVFEWILGGVWNKGLSVLPMSSRGLKYYEYEGITPPEHLL